jgi:hypothetical protein
LKLSIRKRFGLLGLVLLLSAVVGGCSSSPEHRSTPSASSSKSPASAQLAEQRQQILDQYPNAQIPKTHVIREVSLQEWATVVSACMTAAGFPTTADANGQATGVVAAGQDEAHQIATYVCQVEYPLQAKYTTPLDSSQLKRLYVYYTGDLTKCLEKHGVTVPTPPSFQTFSQQYNGSNAWSPYSGEPASVMHLEPKCPLDLVGIYDK